MTVPDQFEIYLVATPGLEAALLAEVRALNFGKPRLVAGGVTIRGGWREVWRANLQSRGASRVLVRIGAFRATHLAQLDKLARAFPWGNFLHRHVPVRVDATCTRSRIYHGGAAAERIATAIREELGAPVDAGAKLTIKARIDDDLCTLSIDTSGEPLHKRGHKEEIGKAPMRETMASLFLRQCGFSGDEPVVDPMCGSGTFVIEAAEMAACINPGRSRHFTFEELVSFDPEAWQQLCKRDRTVCPSVRFYGSDRDAGAIRMSRANAEGAGVAGLADFQNVELSDLYPPQGLPGLVIVNPPYGARIGDKRALQSLYSDLGRILLTRFRGWRVGLITSEPSLARGTGLPFAPPGPPVAHGGLRVFLFQTGALT